MSDTQKLRKMIEEAGRVVFFGGAGVSTESGIPDFRSESGLYKAKQEYGRSPEEMISHSFFVSQPDTFFSYYKSNMLYPAAKPNAAHLGLAAIERGGKDLRVVTQNIDGLHQLAGSREVYELHGSVHRNYCLDCGQTYDLAYILDPANCKSDKHDTEYVPYCAKCGGLVRPDVVLYEEGLDEHTTGAAVDAIHAADLLIVGGTSLAVYPAAGFLNYFRGGNLVLINMSATSVDDRAGLAIRRPIGEVFSELDF
ncbi:MAG: NAD-dependent protein deacylase [Clostridiales Family XIII bacterium]|nr:NAD-dependent protein deacylase [Clostridiales Family XIII bacterium]